MKSSSIREYAVRLPRLTSVILDLLLQRERERERGGESMENVQSAKYLGITITDNMDRWIDATIKLLVKKETYALPSCSQIKGP